MADKKTPKNRVADAANGNGHRANSMAAVEAARSLFSAASILETRSSIASYLGRSYGGDRDLYTALGYNRNPQFNDFMARYRRQDLAKAVIDAPVRASWRKPPELSESRDQETAFEKAWGELAQARNVWHYFSRADRLASIGEYSVLLIGFDDGADLFRPVKRATDVLYLMPYSQASAAVEKYVTDTADARYGLPDQYAISMRTMAIGGGTTTRKVHWSRVLHIAEDMLEDNVAGLPRLEAVFNRLQDLELVSGSSAEMFWRGAFPGLGFKLDREATLGPQDEAALEDEIEEYVHGLKRYLRMRGISIENIAQQIGDPSKQAELFMSLIAAAVRIPKRILFGSEQGELASSQDEVNWWGRIDERRREFCEPVIVRAFVDRCVAFGVLPKPQTAYVCEWPDLLSPSDKDRAEVAKIRSEALAAYIQSGADGVMPFAFYLEKVWGMKRDEIDQLSESQDAEDRDADGDGSEEPEAEEEPETAGVTE